MYIKNESFFEDIFMDGLLFLDMEHGLFYVCPPLTSFVYKSIILGHTIESITNKLLAFSNCPPNVSELIKNALDELIKYDIIKKSNSNIQSTEDINLSEDMFMNMEDYHFDITITVRDDMQDLLLDDPVHEVSLDGWGASIEDSTN